MNIDNMVVETLDQVEDQFLTYVEYLSITSTDRNANWHSEILRRYKDFEMWTIVLRDQKIVAFSGLQKHNFPDQYYRCLSRTYFDQSIRFPTTFPRSGPTPNIIMLAKQIEYLSTIDWKFAMISMEFARRRKVFANHIINKFNKTLKLNFEVMPDMHQTCPSMGVNCWQNLAILRNTSEEFLLPKMSIEQWREKFG